MYNLISMALALFINKNIGTREAGSDHQPRKTVNKLIHTESEIRNLKCNDKCPGIA